MPAVPSARAVQGALPPSEDHGLWHVLQYSDVLDLEFSRELAKQVPTLLWQPDRSLLPVRPGFQEAEQAVPDSTLRLRKFPLVRGYARAPMSKLARMGPSLSRRLARHSAAPARSVLVCTTPYFAPVAERWPGPVVYWLTDLMIRYGGAEPAVLLPLDRQMCQAATLVCPASPRLAEYLHRDARCALGKIEVLPNATREANLLPSPLRSPVAIPEMEALGSGPIAGVLGHLSDNMDWVLLRELLERVPWLSWAFVGPADRPVEDAQQETAFDTVRNHPRAHFLGAKPYGQLWRYARAFDVAVLPYRRREPTFSGSSTRFYEHLAAGHPILATPCVEELMSKEPLLKLVRTAEVAALALEALRGAGFDDGQRQARLEASRHSTWQVRATTMQAALASRCLRASASAATPAPTPPATLASTLTGEHIPEPDAPHNCALPALFA